MPSPRLRLSSPLALVLAAGLVLGSPAPVLAADQATALNAAWSTTSPVYGQQVRVSGGVSPWRGGFLFGGRTVQLQRLDGTTWRVLASARLTSSSYAFAFTSTFIGRKAYRVFVPATGSATSAARTTWVVTRKIPSSLTVAVSRTQVTPRTPVSLSGRVVGGTVAGRSVRVYRRLDSGPRLVASGRTGSSGDFAVSVPTWHYTNDALLVRVLPTSTTARAQSADLTNRVVPGYTPAGSSTQWRPLHTYHRMRFNGCRPSITYRVNPGALGSTYVNEVLSVAARLQVATGIPMRYLGRTSAVPGSGGAWPSDSNVVVAWSTPSRTRWDLSGATVGRGGVTRTRPARDVRGYVDEITRGGVVLDSTFRRWRPGFRTGVSRGKVLLHELGHVMGLGHVGSQSQLMYTDITSRTRWGAGDLNGLQRVGVGGGCMTHPYSRAGRLAGPTTSSP